MQQSYALELKCDHVIQRAFKIDNNNEINEIRHEWFTGTMSKVCNGSNLINVENGKLHPKGRAVELQWHANE